MLVVITRFQCFRCLWLQPFWRPILTARDLPRQKGGWSRSASDFTLEVQNGFAVMEARTCKLDESRAESKYIFTKVRLPSVEKHAVLSQTRAHMKSTVAPWTTQNNICTHGTTSRVSFQLDTLRLRRLALHMALASVPLTGESVKRVRLFFLLRKIISIRSAVKPENNRLHVILQVKQGPSLEIFVGGFLPFFSHRSRWRARKRVNGEEQDGGNGKADSGVQPDSCPFSRRCFGTGTMWAKGYPPCCIANPLA